MNKTRIMSYAYLQHQTPSDLADIVLDQDHLIMNRHSAWETLNSRLPEFNGAAWAGEPLTARLNIIKAMQLIFPPLRGAPYA